MAEKKIILIAALGVAMSALLDKAKGTELEPQLIKFNEDLTAFAAQPVPADQSAMVADLQEQIEDADEMIEDLKKQLQEALDSRTKAPGKPIVKIGNKNYFVNHGVHPYSVKHIVANPDLVKHVLDIKGQNALTPVK